MPPDEPMGHLPSPEDGPQQLEWPVTGLLNRYLARLRRGALLLGSVYHPERPYANLIERFTDALKTEDSRQAALIGD